MEVRKTFLSRHLFFVLRPIDVTVYYHNHCYVIQTLETLHRRSLISSLGCLWIMKILLMAVDELEFEVISG